MHKLALSGNVSHLLAFQVVQEPAKTAVVQSTAPPMAEMFAPGRSPMDKLMDAFKHADPTLMHDIATTTRVALLRAQCDHKVDALPSKVCAAAVVTVSSPTDSNLSTMTTNNTAGEIWRLLITYLHADIIDMMCGGRGAICADPTYDVKERVRNNYVSDGGVGGSGGSSDD